VSSKKVATITTKKLKTTKLASKNIKKEEKITKSIKKTAVKISKKENTKVLHKKTSTKIAKKVDTLKNKSKSKENYKFYTIKKGDSLIKIASKFKISTKKLKKINTFDKNNTLKVGYKIKLPSSVDIKALEKIAAKTKKVKKKNIGYYIVKKGDSLSSIAQSTKVSITKLREINRLSRSSSIKVGEKIYLKPTKLAKRKSRSLKFAKNMKFKKVPSLKHKRKIRVVATAYTSHRNQTDNTPFLAAWNNRIRPGMRIIAVSPDLIRKYGLTNGVRVKIMGLPGFYTVRDKMNKRLRNHIDIYMGVNKRRALRWGRRRIVLYW
jgi:LysM repeat protein